MKRIKSKTTRRSILLLSFVFSPNIGGVESHLDDLCNYLSNKGHRVTVITYRPIGQASKVSFKETKKNMTIFRIPWYHPALFNLFESLPILQIIYLVPVILLFSIGYLLIYRKSVDIIQVHGFNMAIVGYLLSLLFNIKLVINTHVSFSFHPGSIYTRILKMVLNKSSYILVLTQEAKKQLASIGVNNPQILVYHQWIDEKTFRPIPKDKCRAKLDLPHDQFTVLFVGRLSSAKGITILSRTMQRMQSQKIHFVIVGSGPLARTLEQIAQGTDTIHFRGRVPFKDLPYYYSAANVTVIPSTPVTKTYSEGIPRVLIESYTCGTPVIATKTGGTGNHINVHTGLLIKLTAAGLEKAIMKMYTTKQQHKWHSACIEYAQKEFSKNANTTIIEQSLA